MSRWLLDSSALLAVVQEEPGGSNLPDDLSACRISAVSAAEVVGKLVDEGYPGKEADALFLGLMVEIVPFSAAAGRLAGRLRAATNHRGLSLGDRACLATAILSRDAVLTADRAWSRLELGIDIVLIR